MASKTGIIGKIAEGFTESTRAAHSISKENMAAVKAGSKAFREEVTAPHPGMAEFKEAEGLSGKVKAVFNGMGEECKTQKEIERQRRDDAIHLRGTQQVLQGIQDFSGLIMSSATPAKR
jgi:hypothetical protein